MLSLDARSRLPVLLEKVRGLNVVHVLTRIARVLGVLLELGAESRHVLPRVAEGEDETLEEELALVDWVSAS